MPIIESVLYTQTAGMLSSPAVWRWGRRDLNPHALQHMILSHARLPISTLPRTPTIIRKKALGASLLSSHFLSIS